MQLARWRVVGTITRYASANPSAAPIAPAARHRIHISRPAYACQASQQQSNDIHPKAKEVLQFW